MKNALIEIIIIQIFAFGFVSSTMSQDLESTANVECVSNIGQTIEDAASKTLATTSLCKIPDRGIEIDFIGQTSGNTDLYGSFDQLLALRDGELTDENQDRRIGYVLSPERKKIWTVNFVGQDGRVTKGDGSFSFYLWARDFEWQIDDQSGKSVKIQYPSDALTWGANRIIRCLQPTKAGREQTCVSYSTLIACQSWKNRVLTYPNPINRDDLAIKVNSLDDESSEWMLTNFDVVQAKIDQITNEFLEYSCKSNRAENE